MARRLAAIMFTDIAGYTALSQRDEPAALRLLQDQERLVRGLLEVHQGRWVKSMGDGLLIEFSNALDAVECAVDVQRHIQERNKRNSGPSLRVRIGIHLGDVEGAGSDILGDAVNLASRIEPLAEPGGICLSEPVYGQVRNKVSYTIETLGSKNLKGVSEPMEVYRVVMPWAGSADATGKPSPLRIAVLPFANFSPDPADVYFADGLTDELISALSKVRELSVISRTSVMEYRARTKHMTDIGRELAVGTILEGSVRKAGTRVRIAVQMIDAGTDKHLWAETYDGSLEDVFSTQSEIAQRVASALKVQLLEEERLLMAKTPTEVTEAHLLYMKGQYHYQQWTKEGFTTALWYFEQAVEKDPRYALAYAAQAETYAFLAFWEMIPVREALTKTEAMATKALALDPNLAEAHVALWDVLFDSWKQQDALNEARRAIDLNPSLARAHVCAGYSYSFTRQRGAALQEAEKALALDPLSRTTIEASATIDLYGGRPERARELYESLAKIDPAGSWRGNLGLSYVRLGRFDEGIAEIRAAIDQSKGANLPQYSDLAYALSKAGRLAEAREVLGHLLREYQAHGRGTTCVAYAYASVGDRDEAFRWLEKAFQERAPYLGGILQEFSLEALHGDPRLDELLNKMGFPPFARAE